jgi:hypothetical protein
MKDSELDRLLDSWQAPTPPRSLKDGLQKRLPLLPARSFTRPLRWAMLIAVGSVTLAIGMEQSGGNALNSRLVRVVNQVYENLLAGFEAWRASSLVAHIRQSSPQVYVDGQLAGSLEYGPAATMNVRVPDEGLYSIISYSRGLTGWVEAGRIHANMIEFRAGARQVRIECDRPIVASDLPVFVRRR